MRSEADTPVCVATTYNEGCKVEKENGAAIATGNYGVAIANGAQTIAIVTGIYGAATALKPETLALAWGMNSKAKGVLDSHIGFRYQDNEGTHVVVHKVDGVNIKADTWYAIAGGALKEIE